MRFTNEARLVGDIVGAAELHGWPLSPTTGAPLVTLEYSSVTRKVTLTALSGSTFDIFVQGQKITVASPFVSDAHAATAGSWFFYHSGSAWVWSQTPWDMTLVAPTCYVYWSTVANEGVPYIELHNAERDAQWHKLEHSARGTALLSGGVLGDYVLNSDVDANLRFSISACVIADEDIRTSIDAKAAGGPFTIWRRSGTSGVWTWTTAETMPYLFGTYPQRNYDAGGGTGWTTADVTGAGAGSWLTSYVIAVPALAAVATTQRFIIVPGQTEHASLAAAQAELFGSLALGDLPWPEAVPIAQLVFHARSTYTNASNAELVSVTRLLGSRATISLSGSPSAHSSLTGLQGGTAGQYYHLTAAEYGAAQSAQLTLGSGVAQVQSLANFIFPIVITVTPVSGDTIQVELEEGTYSTIGSYTTWVTIIIDHDSGETAPTNLRVTRTAGTGVASKVTIRG